jgi:hypothetical protein
MSGAIATVETSRRRDDRDFRVLLHRIIDGQLGDQWIYILGPLIGGLIGGLVHAMFREPERRPDSGTQVSTP